jgi:hypothetical protein
MDYLILRNSIFELDNSLKYTNDYNIKSEFINKTLAMRKKNTYVNNEPFEQFCNQLINDELILNRFSNISYSISSTVLHKGMSIKNTYSYSLLKLHYNNPIQYKFDIEFKRTGYRVIRGNQKFARKSNIF